MALPKTYHLTDTKKQIGRLCSFSAVILECLVKWHAQMVQVTEPNEASVFFYQLLFTVSADRSVIGRFMDDNVVRIENGLCFIDGRTGQRPDVLRKLFDVRYVTCKIEQELTVLAQKDSRQMTNISFC